MEKINSLFHVFSSSPGSVFQAIWPERIQHLFRLYHWCPGKWRTNCHEDKQKREVTCVQQLISMSSLHIQFIDLNLNLALCLSVCLSVCYISQVRVRGPTPDICRYRGVERHYKEWHFSHQFWDPKGFGVKTIPLEDPTNCHENSNWRLRVRLGNLGSASAWNLVGSEPVSSIHRQNRKLLT